MITDDTRSINPGMASRASGEQHPDNSTNKHNPHFHIDFSFAKRTIIVSVPSRDVKKLLIPRPLPKVSVRFSPRLRELFSPSRQGGSGSPISQFERHYHTPALVGDVGWRGACTTALTQQLFPRGFPRVSSRSFRRGPAFCFPFGPLCGSPRSRSPSFGRVPLPPSAVSVLARLLFLAFCGGGGG